MRANILTDSVSIWYNNTRVDLTGFSLFLGEEGSGIVKRARSGDSKVGEAVESTEEP